MSHVRASSASGQSKQQESLHMPEGIDTYNEVDVN